MATTLNKPKTLPLTPTERNTLDVIKALFKKGYGPSFEEIARAVGVSVARAHRLVGNLIDKGYLTQEKGRYRSLQMVEGVR
jgi:DNA-binding IclR family transcriptional regulator